LEAQVKDSIEQSFKNLKIDFIDILMLHAPFGDDDDNLIAWKVFETFVPDRIGVLGVSNFPLAAFEKLFTAATIKPEVVQNRFDEANGYDSELRGFLEEKGIIYQAFSVLKGCDKLLASNLVTRFSKQFQLLKEVAFYLLVLGLGKKMTIVNGTTSEEHMQLDLQKTRELITSPSKVEAVKSYLGEFGELLRTHSNYGRPV
jgi:diketogulonate reductase-like aldo/keto reductase